MKKILYCATFSLLWALTHVIYAQGVTMIVPGSGKLETSTVKYQCDEDRHMEITYINKGANTLAIIPVEKDAILVFAGAISASGARYTANEYQWSTKDTEGMLTSEITQKTIRCHESK
jgi:membrane-bound inhibitor of C-type lysozyme